MIICYYLKKLFKFYSVHLLEIQLVVLSIHGFNSLTLTQFIPLFLSR